MIVAVIVPCFNAGRLVLETIASLDEPEPLEIVVVDDASDDPVTHEALTNLETAGVTVIRQDENGGAACARGICPGQIPRAGHLPTRRS